MASPDDRRLLEAARSWNQEGLLAPGALATLETRFANGATQGPDSLGNGALALFALGGALVGAALITVVTVTDLRRDLASLLLAPLGVLLAAFGIALPRLVKLGQGIEEVLLVAGCVALGAGLFAAPQAAGYDAAFVTLPVIAPLAAVAFGVLPFLVRARSAAPSLAVALFAIASYRTLSLAGRRDAFIFDELATNLQLAWMAVLAGMALLIWFGARNAPWRPLALGASIVALVAPLVLLLGDALSLRSEFAELVVGLFFGGILAAALWQRERTVILASALVIAGDAVVFGFDAGGAGLGVIVLLAVAGGLVAVAVRFRPQLSAR